MDASNNSSAFAWIMTLVSFAVMTALLIFIPEWFWLALPFSLTYLTKALNAM